MQVDFEDTDLIMTEPMLNFTSVQESMAEVLFEEYQFNSVLHCNGRLFHLLFSNLYANTV